MEAVLSLADRLPPGMVSTHHGELATHAHDRWALALLRELRGDRVPPPAALAYPRATEHVAAILAWAEETGTPVVPRGGGTGVVGGAEAVRRSVVVDLSRMDRVLEVDPVSQTVTAEAGVRGAALEAALAPRGLTLGHDPASLRLSTVGGWVAAASVGAASTGYGSAADLLLGLTVVLAGGSVVRLKPAPRSAAGPDLRRLFVGSEGTLGIVTEVTLAASRQPSGYLWEALAPRAFDSGAALVREIVQRPFRPLVLRLLDAREAATTFAAFGYAGRPLVVLGYDAGAPAIEAERFEALALARDLGARAEDRRLAEHWWDHRHDGVDWYEAVMGPERVLGPGVVVDLAEFATVWRHVPRLYEEVRGALLDHAETVTCQLTDPTSSGAALLFTFTLRAEDDRAVEDRYWRAWRDALGACLAAGGTITHNHGVGLLRAAFLEQEVGASGVEVLRRIRAALDRRGVMNPGKVLPPER